MSVHSTCRGLVLCCILSLLCSDGVAGVKGGTLSIEKAGAIVLEEMEWQSPRWNRMTETLRLKDQKRFLVVNIEVSIDWSDNDKATEHTILRKEIKLTASDGSELALVGRHGGYGGLYDWLPSHIHLQRSNGDRFYAHLVFAAPRNVSGCVLSIEKSSKPVVVPKSVSKIKYEHPAKFRVVEADLIDEVPGGEVPRQGSLFEVSMRPVSGKILEVTVEALPTMSNNAATAQEGFYSETQRFRFRTSDLGVVLPNGTYIGSFAGEMSGKAYSGVSTRRTLTEQSKPMAKKAYFFVPADTRSFELAYRKVVAAKGVVGG